MLVAATIMMLRLCLEGKVKERGLSSNVSIAKGPTTQLTSAISCMGIPTTDKEHEARI